MLHIYTHVPSHPNGNGFQQGANNINLHLALDLMHYKHPTVHLKRPKETKLIYTTYNKYTIAFKVNTAKRASCLGGGSRSLSVIVVLYSLSVLFTSSVFV